MIPVLIGFAVVAAGLSFAFRLLEGHRLMASYDPARAWQEGRERLSGALWNEVTLPAEPINTWSNLTYYMAGWVPMLAGPYAGTLQALLFGLAMTYLAIGSALFHGTLTDWGQVVADHGGMISVFAVLCAFSLAPASPLIVFPMFFGGVLGAVYGGRTFEGDLDVIIGIGFAPPLFLALRLGDMRLALVSLGVLALAFALSKGLDKAGSPFLGRWKHGIWHALSGAAITLMFLAQR